MAKKKTKRLRYVGIGHNRIITTEDLQPKGMKLSKDINVWRGDVVRVPADVAEWLQSEYSNEATDWEDVAGDDDEDDVDASGDQTDNPEDPPAT